jgi:hypothetical protein
MQDRRVRKQFAEPGALAHLAAYAGASRAVQRSVLKLLVEINMVQLAAPVAAGLPLKAPAAP